MLSELNDDSSYNSSSSSHSSLVSVLLSMCSETNQLCFKACQFFKWWISKKAEKIVVFYLW